MAVYKVPQDVEADDKFLGPLSFKQFLFFGAAMILGYIVFVTLTSGTYVVSILLMPFFLFFAALAFPWSKEQPTELWLASRIRFLIVPRRRIWNQSGIRDLVEITVPKREVHFYTDGLDQSQVRNRVNALANVIDTRGWAVKNLTRSFQPQDDSDRLVGATESQDHFENSTIVNSTVDILDAQSSPVGQQFNTLIDESTNRHRREIMEKFEAARHENDATQQQPQVPQNTQQVAIPEPVAQQNPAIVVQPTSGQQQLPAQPTLMTPPPQAPPTTPAISAQDEQALLAKIHDKQRQEQDLREHSHMRTINPLYTTPQVRQRARQEPPATPSTPPIDPAILALAQNDDLNVETIARQVKHDRHDDDDEVVISLR